MSEKNTAHDDRVRELCRRVDELPVTSRRDLRRASGSRQRGDVLGVLAGRLDCQDLQLLAEAIDRTLGTCYLADQLVGGRAFVGELTDPLGRVWEYRGAKPPRQVQASVAIEDRHRPAGPGVTETADAASEPAVEETPDQESDCVIKPTKNRGRPRKTAAAE